MIEAINLIFDLPFFPSLASLPAAGREGRWGGSESAKNNPH
ncbi:MAG: hypothetical protein V1799_21015 [bacterium]